LLIIFLALLVFGLGKRIEMPVNKWSKKQYLILGIFTLLLILILFKYSQMIQMTLMYLLHGKWVKYSVALPLGISFFTFEFIHYLVDVYHKKIPKHRPVEFFSFILFFPTLVSGPVKRFQNFIDSTRSSIIFNWQYVYTGLFYILIGYSQKYFIADNLISRTVFLANPSLAPSNVSLLSGIFFYSFRIYADFAGLSNIAIGSAFLFGVTVPVNFNYPYLQKDPAQFWRNWHMSLTTWIKEYIYMPIVFRFRNQPFITTAALVLTMTLIGIWHGSSWNFLFFGLYHGIGLAILQLWRSWPNRPRLNLPPNLAKIIGPLLTFIYVSFGWPFFATSSLSDSILIYHRIFSIL
jgi:alginate O-acetyltransferase complex protein AlgI